MNEGDLRDLLEKLSRETRQHFDVVTGGLRTEVAEARQHFDVVTGDLRTEVAEARRHFDVVAERIGSDVRLVSEGVETNGERIEGLSKQMRDEFDETNAMIRLSYSELDRRLRTLEEVVSGLQNRVQRLEADGRDHTT